MLLPTSDALTVNTNQNPGSQSDNDSILFICTFS